MLAMLWIAMLGGLLIMMGQHDRSEALFYYFRLEDQVPGTHLLRLIEKHISFAFVRQRLKDSYSETGRPSIDPELLLRILLIGHLYGITSERKLVEELRMHLAWRWFTGLGFDQEIPHHSTFSKNRHGRFQESKLFEQLFEQIVRQCVDVGLVQGTHLSVDGSFIEANAANESRIPREQLGEAPKFILGGIPTALNEISTRPALPIADCKCWSIACSSRASTSAASADPPADTMSLATASTAGLLCPVRKTLAPSFAKARATAPPIAPPAP
jgi:transposase